MYRIKYSDMGVGKHAQKKSLKEIIEIAVNFDRQGMYVEKIDMLNNSGEVKKEIWNSNNFATLKEATDDLTRLLESLESKNSKP